MLKNLTIATRIYGLALTLLAAICVVAFVGLDLAATSNQGGRQTHEQSMKPLQTMGEIAQLMAENRSADHACAAARSGQSGVQAA